MADTTEQRIVQLRDRLQDSRSQFFDLARAMNGHPSASAEAHGEPAHSGFPHSRLMRALMGKSAGVALGTAAVAATVLKPGLLMGALRLTPMLRPLLTRYLLPRLFGR